jgi:hypothetical protein
LTPISRLIVPVDLRGEKWVSTGAYPYKVKEKRANAIRSYMGRFGTYPYEGKGK